MRLTPKFSNKVNIITFDLPWARSQQPSPLRGPQMKLLTRPCPSSQTGWAVGERIDIDTLTFVRSHAASAGVSTQGLALSHRAPPGEGIVRHALSHQLPAAALSLPPCFLTRGGMPLASAERSRRLDGDGRLRGLPHLPQAGQVVWGSILIVLRGIFRPWRACLLSTPQGKCPGWGGGIPFTIISSSRAPGLEETVQAQRIVLSLRASAPGEAGVPPSCQAPSREQQANRRVSATVRPFAGRTGDNEQA